MHKKNWHNWPSDHEPLDRRVWFITGASRGLGLSFVKQLLVKGDQVAATTRSSQALSDEIHNSIPIALARNFLPLEVDLGNESAIAEAIDAAYKTFGRLDVVVNNAGYTLDGAMETLAPPDIHRCFTINTTAAMTVMQKVMPYLQQQRSGFILNIASLTACASATDSSLYAATKYAILALSQRLAEEANKLNISITVVAPAAFQPRLYTREYDMLENIRSCDHAAASFIRLAEQPAPPPILLVGANTFTTQQKEKSNEIQLTR